MAPWLAVMLYRTMHAMKFYKSSKKKVERWKITLSVPRCSAPRASSAKREMFYADTRGLLVSWRRFQFIISVERLISLRYNEVSNAFFLWRFQGEFDLLLYNQVRVYLDPEIVLCLIIRVLLVNIRALNLEAT